MKPESQLGIAKTPEPPYYAVTTTALLGSNLDGYAETAGRLLEQAQQLPGFLGLEVCLQPGLGIAISYWKSLEDIQHWRDHADHRHAKQRARAQWFDCCLTRIAKVEAAY